MSVWQQQSEVRIQKYKKLGKLLSIHQELSKRQAIAVWDEFTQYCIQLNKMTDQYMQEKKESLCRNVLFVLQNYSKKKISDKVRVQFLKEFLVRRLKIRTFVKLYRVKIERIESATQETKVNWFRKANLYVRVMRSLYKNRIFQVQSRYRIQICH